LYSKQPKEFENEIEWKQWLKQLVVGRKTEILHYWKAKQFDFPIVSQMARDHLAIPAMLAPLERVFSSSGNVVTKNRNRLSGDSVREIVCLRNWGVITEEDDDSDSDGDRDGDGDGDGDRDRDGDGNDD
jgi:hAT family C-terminal dimerisation region